MLYRCFVPTGWLLSIITGSLETVSGVLITLLAIKLVRRAAVNCLIAGFVVFDFPKFIFEIRAEVCGFGSRYFNLLGLLRVFCLFGLLVYLLWRSGLLTFGRIVNNVMYWVEGVSMSDGAYINVVTQGLLLGLRIIIIRFSLITVHWDSVLEFWSQNLLSCILVVVVCVCHFCSVQVFRILGGCGNTWWIGWLLGVLIVVTVE